MKAKANELRIGNLVVNQHGSIKEIIEISKDNYVAKPVDAFLFHIEPVFQSGKTIENILPIPLTEEWLLRFGFEFCDYEPSADDDDDFIFKEYRFNIKDKKVFYTICECPCNEWEFCVVFPWTEPGLLSSIKYVHQLQNLYFALTGQELELRSES